MREIKFRAWNGKKMYIPDELINNPVSVGHFDSSGYAKIEKDIVMQFTGLLDKNGKEIYEGDILLDIERGQEERFRGPVIYQQTEFVVRYKNLRNKTWCEITYLAEEKNTQWEVIGNIYEHPELLK